MKEAEVSLRIAHHYIISRQTINDVRVSLDGAQIKTGDSMNFSISDFMNEIGAVQDIIETCWQGRYSIPGYKAGIIIHSHPGEGDINIKLVTGRTLFIECKGFSIEGDKGSREYSRMREAIGQLLTCTTYSELIDYAVGVPDSKKSREKANEWSKLHQIRSNRIKFFLVNRNGLLTII
jgi:hypothetical protein